MLLRCEPEQIRAHERAGTQIEAASSLFGSKLFSFRLSLNLRQFPKLCYGKWNRERRCNYLYCLPSLCSEARAQDFVPPDNFVNTAFKSSDVERSRDPNSARHVVKRIARFQLVEKPEPLLGKR